MERRREGGEREGGRRGREEREGEREEQRVITTGCMYAHTACNKLPAFTTDSDIRTPARAHTSHRGYEEDSRDGGRVV